MLVRVVIMIGLVKSFKTIIWPCLGDEIGRLARLKILCTHVRAGSSPARGTNSLPLFALFQIRNIPSTASKKRGDDFIFNIS